MSVSPGTCNSVSSSTTKVNDMIGDLLDRGIGFYYTYEEMMVSGDLDGPMFIGNINPGHILGFTLGAVYVAWPLDFIPDFIPVIGYLDDAAILSGSTNLGGWLWDLMD
jgi:hypothetical protein